MPLWPLIDCLETTHTHTHTHTSMTNIVTERVRHYTLSKVLPIDTTLGEYET